MALGRGRGGVEVELNRVGVALLLEEGGQRSHCRAVAVARVFGDHVTLHAILLQPVPHLVAYIEIVGVFGHAPDGGCTAVPFTGMSDANGEFHVGGVVAGAGLEPATSGYGPDKIPFLHPAVVVT